MALRGRRLVVLRRSRTIVALMVGWALSGLSVQAAETVGSARMTQTSLVFELGTLQRLPIRTRFQSSPPTILIEIPLHRLSGIIPAQTALPHGVIREISARYESNGSDEGSQRIRTLEITLTATYRYRVRSEVGRITVEIFHPTSIESASMVLGLTNGTFTNAGEYVRLTDRFRAMQDALIQATPMPWSIQMDLHAPSTAGASPTGSSDSAAHDSEPSGSVEVGTLVSPTAKAAAPSVVGVMISVIMVLLVGLTIRHILSGQVTARWSRRPAGARRLAGMVLLDQLVWRAFERQGYQLLTEREAAEPLGGPLRVMIKDGTKTALLFVGNGPFFEKQTVERFVAAMRETSVAQGFLVAAGSFTVPAQRLAREHQVVLIGREQLTELLSAGAKSEYLSKELEQHQARLEELKETLRQYAAELDTLRRQRNDSSWFLGEERAKTAKLESELEALTKQVRNLEVELSRAQQELVAAGKRWDESQWFLGESRARVQYLEQQLESMGRVAQDAAAATAQAQQDTTSSPAEEQTDREGVEQTIAQLQQRLQESVEREQELRNSLAHVTQEVSAFRRYGERRSHPRVQIPDATVEVYNGTDAPVVAGAARDVSRGGFGLETDQEIHLPPLVRVRLAVPGHDPIESKAQLIWQRGLGEPSNRYYNGFYLVDIPASKRKLIQKLIEERQTSPA